MSAAAGAPALHELTAAPAALPPDVIDVWRIAVTPPSAAALAVLSPDERARATQFRRDEDRHRFVQGRCHLRQALGRYLARAPDAIAFEIDGNGKPCLGGLAPDIHFNLSHSGDRLYLAFARGPVGIDVQVLRDHTDADAIADRFYAPGEQALLRGIDAASRRQVFHEIWVRKEAYAKADGRGLLLTFRSFSVLEHAAWRRPFWQVEQDGSVLPSWLLVDLPEEDGTLAAVAGGAGLRGLRLWQPDAKPD